MDMAILSLVFLFGFMIISVFMETNPGIIAFALTYVLYIIAGIGFKTALAGFPIKTFVMIMSMLVFYNYAKVNGTLDKLCIVLMKAVKGKVGYMPMLIFLITLILGATGPASYIVFAVGPIAMAIAGKAGINPLLMSVMLCNGAGASSLSPVAAGGVVTYGIVETMGLAQPTADIVNRLFINGIIGNVSIGIIAYFLFGGVKLIKENKTIDMNDLKVEPFTTKQRINLFLIVAMIIGIVAFKLEMAMVCFVLIIICSVLKLGDDEEVLKTTNWGVLLMLAGISTFIGAIESFGGIDVFTTLVANSNSKAFAIGVMGGLAGLVSSYSLSTGVVMPTFLPIVASLITKLPNVHYMSLLSAVTFCAYIVDASPMSGAGAACIAYSSEDTDRRKMYKNLLYWGLSMSVIGAVFSIVVFGYIMY